MIQTVVFCAVVEWMSVVSPGFNQDRWNVSNQWLWSSLFSRDSNEYDTDWHSRSVSSDAKKLTLDPNTAHRDLSLSEGNRKATRWTEQPYPDLPERFDFWRQVLCMEGLTGRCYWETEWSGRAFIGVAYRRMTRKGEGHDSWLGKNDSSWGLNCNSTGYRTWHRGMETAVAIQLVSNRVGVFLDWPAGKLSFFQVSGGEPTLLHSFHTTFTEPVYPGFRLGWVDSTVYLC